METSTRSRIRKNRVAIFSAAALLASLLPAPPPCRGAAADSPESNVLQIGVHDKPPYAFYDDTGRWTGIAVDLWRQIARERGWEYQFQELPFEELVPALTERRIDLVAGELEVNPEDELVIDFTQPFLESSVGVAVSSRDWNPNWLHILLHAFDWTLVRIFLLFVPLLVAVSFLFWALERRRADGHFGGEAFSGIGSAFWFSAVTMTTTGYGDKVPVTFAGRVLAIFWMIFSLLLVTAFTASVASTVASVKVGSLVRSPEDLRHYRNGVLNGSYAERLLSRFSAPVVAFESYEAAFEELVGGSVDTVVGDSVSISFLIEKTYRGRAAKLPMNLALSRVAFALPQESALREKMNVEILRAVRTEEWLAALESYLGPSGHAPPVATLAAPGTAPKDGTANDHQNKTKAP